jgi:hypothetical protein
MADIRRVQSAHSLCELQREVGSVELEQDIGATLSIIMVSVHSEGVAEVLAEVR